MLPITLAPCRMGSFVIFKSPWMKSILCAAFMPHFPIRSCPTRSHDFLFGVRQGELKNCASRLIYSCPQSAAVSIDNRAADRESYAHPARFRRIESVENAFKIFRIDTASRIAHGHQDAFYLILFGA